MSPQLLALPDQAEARLLCVPALPYLFGPLVQKHILRVTSVALLCSVLDVSVNDSIS